MTTMAPNRSLLLLLPCILGTASGFASIGSRGRASSIKAPSTFLSSTSAPEDTSGTTNSLDGVAEFEEWFATNASSGAKVDNIRHALFESMGRGLCFTSTKSSDLNKVAAVPRKLVLNVPFSDEEESDSGLSWDTNLSCKLWEECRKGKASNYYG